jgi:hypothetical protein
LTTATRGGAFRIGGAEVADDDDAVAQAVGQDRPQLLHQQRLVAGGRVAAAGQLLQRQRALGQVLENQRGRAATLDQRAHHRRRHIGAITGKTGAATYCKCLHRYCSPWSGGRRVRGPLRRMLAAAPC